MTVLRFALLVFAPILVTFIAFLYFPIKEFSADNLAAFQHEYQLQVFIRQIVAFVSSSFIFLLLHRLMLKKRKIISKESIGYIVLLLVFCFYTYSGKTAILRYLERPIPAPPGATNITYAYRFTGTTLGPTTLVVQFDFAERESKAQAEKMKEICTFYGKQSYTMETTCLQSVDQAYGVVLREIATYNDPKAYRSVLSMLFRIDLGGYSFTMHADKHGMSMSGVIL